MRVFHGSIMTLLYAVYLFITTFFFLLLLPYLLLYVGVTGRYAPYLSERFGFIPKGRLLPLTDCPRIWIHAVSLGEVKVAEAVIRALKKQMPACSVIVSTTTTHGRSLAHELFPDDIPVIYAPVDWVFAVKNALARVRPDVMVFLETEIWPAWLFEARRKGIATALVNGRISVRSIDGYRTLRPLIRQVLENVDAFSMILEDDAHRILSMGAIPERVVINGNAKYDRIASGVDADTEDKMRRILDVRPSDRVMVAGSTRQGEEEMILDAYRDICRRFPETILIIAPRHLERVPQICRVISSRGLAYQLRTRIGREDARRTAPVVVIDTFGDLFAVYSVGTVVFCGASLVPLGGQNPLEPAVWGKPVIYGPSMDDFLDAKAILASENAGITVSGPGDLAETVIRLFADPEELQSMGARARHAVQRHRGAACAHAAVIARLAARCRNRPNSRGIQK